MTAVLENVRFRLPFTGSDRVKRNFSQAGQDVFVLSLLNGKRGGVFLDLGCSDAVVINNTALLESQFDWTGLSVDIDESHFPSYFYRECKTLASDCTRLDWESVIGMLGTSKIDYLSLDLEPPDLTLAALKNIPFDRVEFSVVTFEHDAYRAGETVRKASRETFARHGYVRLCSDVLLEGLVFEDWYCHPHRVDLERCSVLASDRMPWQQIVFESN